MNKCEHGSFDADYCVSCLRALLAEARAEVEGLKAQVWGLQITLKAASSVAFLRGAEAMREAAAREAVRRPFVNCTPESIQRAIAALDIPEDKL